LIAGITREIASAWRIDERRVYVAGLSAGGAMAIVLGATYPELYAAVGAHSGLAYGSAHDVPSAFAAMKGNSAADSAARYGENLVRQGINALPTVVFHGDSDQTVAVANASIIVDQAIAAMANQAQLLVVREEGMTAGRSYSRTAYAVESDPPLFEHWTIRGAGHAWSGGSVNGSFTDIRGPDASAEMIKFFQTHAR
jgi:poly(3-hydroxybutyrate) depolymerase